MHFLKLSLPKVCLLTLYFITPITSQRVLEVKKVLPAVKAEPSNDSNQKDSQSSGPALSLKLVASSQSPQAPAPSPASQSSPGPTPTPAPPSNPQPENNDGDKDNKPNSPPPNDNPPANVVATTIFKPFTNLPANPADPNPAPTPAPAPNPPPSGGQNPGNPPPPNNNGGPNSTDYKNPNGNSAASTTDTGDSGFNTILYTGIGVGVVVLAALVSIFILRKWKFSPSERFKTKLTPDIYTQRTYESDHQFLRDLHSS
jgi:hypothetical protein